MGINDLIDLSEQVYIQRDWNNNEFRYEVIKSKYPQSVGAIVNNLVVDGYLKSNTRTLVLTANNQALTMNFGS